MICSYPSRIQYEQHITISHPRFCSEDVTFCCSSRLSNIRVRVANRRMPDAPIGTRTMKRGTWIGGKRWLIWISLESPWFGVFPCYSHPEQLRGVFFRRFFFPHPFILLPHVRTFPNLHSPCFDINLNRGNLYKRNRTTVQASQPWKQIYMKEQT